MSLLQNCDSKKKSQDCEIKTRNCKKKSQNYELKIAITFIFFIS